MPYPNLSIADVPVVIGDSPTKAFLTLSQNETGVLKLMVKRPWVLEDLREWWLASPKQILSTADAPPFVRIERALLTKGAEIDEFSAPEAEIRYTAISPDSSATHLSAVFYLSGVHFPDGVIEFDVGGFHWTMELLDGIVTSGNKPLGVATCALSCRNVAFARFSDLESAAWDIAALLSYGSGIPVRLLRVDYAASG